MLPASYSAAPLGPPGVCLSDGAFAVEQREAIHVEFNQACKITGQCRPERANEGRTLEAERCSPNCITAQEQNHLKNKIRQQT